MFRVYYWDTFDNETFFIEKFNTFQEAEDYIETIGEGNEKTSL